MEVFLLWENILKELMKKRIVEEKLNGKSYSYVAKKYNVRNGTIANWKKKYLEGTLQNDGRGRNGLKVDKDLEYEILKKSYALLMEIRSQQNK